MSIDPSRLRSRVQLREQREQLVARLSEVALGALEEQGRTRFRFECPDCGAKVGQPHDPGCDVEQCTVCNQQRLSCDHTAHDPTKARWTGHWPGTAPKVVWTVDESLFRRSGGKVYKLALHIAGLSLDRGDFDRSGFYGEPDIERDGTVIGVPNSWSSTVAGALLTTLSHASEDRFLLATWKHGKGEVFAEDASRDFDSEGWRGPEWHTAAAHLMPGVFTHHFEGGVTIVLLGERDDDQTAFDPSNGERSLHWLGRALDMYLFEADPHLEVDGELPTMSGPPTRWRDESFVVRGQHELLELMTVPSGTGYTGPEDRFEWWILREDADLSWVPGNLIAVDGGLIVEARGPAEETRDLLRQMGIEAGFERVVIADHRPSRGGWAEAAEAFREHLPEQLSERNQELQGRLRSVGDDQLQIRLRELEDLWAMLAREITPPPALEGDDPFLLAYTDDQPTPKPPEREVPRVVWVSQAAGTRANGRLEGLAAEYHPEQNLLEINADFPVFLALTRYWVNLYAEARNLSADPIWQEETKAFVEDEKTTELRLVVAETMREWCEQSLGEVCAGARALLQAGHWDEAQLAAATSPQALSAASLAIYHTQQAIKRSLGQRLGSLKKEQVV